MIFFVETDMMHRTRVRSWMVVRDSLAEKLKKTTSGVIIAMVAVFDPFSYQITKDINRSRA